VRFQVFTAVYVKIKVLRDVMLTGKILNWHSEPSGWPRIDCCTLKVKTV
jgi:hypothetical protein